MKRKSKPVSATAVEDHHAMIFPHDLNPQDRMFGGMLVGEMDRLAGDIFFKHTEGQDCGTKRIDDVPFDVPAYKGDLLLLSASINRVWGSSCEIGMRANIMRKKTGRIQHLSSTFLTYVATEEIDEIDPETGHPKLIAVPIKYTVSPRTPEQKRRFREADERKEERKAKKSKHNQA